MSVIITAQRPPMEVYMQMITMPIRADVNRSQPRNTVQIFANTRICTATQKTKVITVTMLTVKPVGLPKRL